MRIRVIALLAMIFLLAPVPRAEPAVCFSSSIFGTYVLTLGGTDAEGRSVSHIAVVALAVANASGNGTFTGTIFANARGVAPATRALDGTYQIFENCWMTLRVPEPLGTTTRIGSLTGFVAQNGSLIVLASAFDSAIQITGTATLVPF